MKNIMKMQSEHLSGTKDRFGEVSHSVEVTQREIMDIDSMISHMDKERIGVVDIVQGLTAIAEENAAGTQESLASTEMVNGMIKDVADVAKELAELANAIEADIDIFKV